MNGARKRVSGRVSGPILMSLFHEVLNLSAAADKFVIHVHGIWLVGWSFCRLFEYVFTILAFPGFVFFFLFFCNITSGL